MNTSERETARTEIREALARRDGLAQILLDAAERVERAGKAQILLADYLRLVADEASGAPSHLDGVLRELDAIRARLAPPAPPPVSRRETKPRFAADAPKSVARPGANGHKEDCSCGWCSRVRRLREERLAREAGVA